MGFEWRLRDGNSGKRTAQVGDNSERFDLVYRGLEAYKAVRGDLDVPLTFKVPKGDSAWSEDLWGLKLGVEVQGLREKNELVHGLADREEKLNLLGFVWEESGRVSLLEETLRNGVSGTPDVQGA